MAKGRKEVGGNLFHRWKFCSYFMLILRLSQRKERNLFIFIFMLASDSEYMRPCYLCIYDDKRNFRGKDSCKLEIFMGLFMRRPIVRHNSSLSRLNGQAQQNVKRALRTLNRRQKYCQSFHEYFVNGIT